MRHERIYLNQMDSRAYIDTYVVDRTEPRDAMLVIPGGAYNDVCADREGEPVALSFVERGYNAFVLGYRVGKAGDVFPKQLIDAGSAMLYIRSHAEELHINPERVFAVGFSAGGHLAASISTMFEYPEAREAFGDDCIKIRPTGVILAYPVVSLLEHTHINTFARLLGRPNADFTEEERRRYSIECIVDEKSAPMFIWHTATDVLAPPEASLKLGYVLAKKHISFMLNIYPYGPHGISIANGLSDPAKSHNQPLAAEWVDHADKWMKTLKNY